MTISMPYASIEELLGPAAGRFFGAGFKQVQRSVDGLLIDAHGVRATAALRYPSAWSVKEHRNPRPHLSTLDALLITGDLTEAYLTHTHGLTAEQRRRCWLTAFDMRVVVLQEELDKFAVSAVVGSTAPVPGDAGIWRTSFAWRVGTFSGHSVVEHETGPVRAGGACYGTAVELLGDPGERYHGDGYKQRTQDVCNVRLGRGGTRVEADVSVHQAPGTPLADRGFSAAFEPSLSMLDAVVALAQMTQAMTYQLDGIDRAASNTFLMRRLAMERDTPLEPTDAPLPASMAIAKTGRPPRGGETWRTLVVTGGIAGIRVQSAVAHQLPAGVAGSNR